jgi:CubicO group peptidase (beta-lactamase class C family)
MKDLIRVCLLIALTGSAWAKPPGSSLPRSIPERQGVSSAAMLDFVNTLDEQIDGMHSLMVVRHGEVIAEGWWAPYEAAHSHVLFSLSKSFTSTAVGLAVAEGKMSIDDEVLKFFPEDAPTNTSNNLKAMRVRDLLMMSTGHQDEPSSAADVVSAKSFLAQAVPHLPGTHFKYNTAATFMQSAIVQKVTGQTVLDFLETRLFGPLGIEHPTWETNFQGISLGGYGLRARTEDIAKFGQLYLQKGNWNGKQLLPGEWVAMATAKQTSNGSNPKSDWNQGYGFQFWRCRHNAYRGDGAFGQYCVVMPEQDAVVAITSGVKDMQAVLNGIWDKLLPAMKSGPLPANATAGAQLRDKLAGLKVRTPLGSATSPLSGKALRFAFPANEQKVETLALSSGPGNTLTLKLQRDGRNVVIPCGHQEWKRSKAPLFAGRLAQLSEEPTAGAFAWRSDDTCVIKICAYETPYHTTVTLKFDGDQMTLDSENNVGFGATKRPQLIGRLRSDRASGQ